MPNINAKYAVIGKYQAGGDWFVDLASDTFVECADRFADRRSLFAYVQRVMVTNDGEVIYEFAQRSL